LFREFGIRFSRTDLRRWLSAVVRVQATAIRERNRLPRTCSIDYYQLVYRNIVSQKHTGGYPLYHPRYAKWKERVAAQMDYWRLFNILLKNLKSFRVQSEQDEVAYMGGIDNNAVGRHGKKIAMYGTAVETGYFGPGTRRKPRPIFKPSGIEYSNKSWKRRNFSSLNKIKEAWR